MAFNVDKDKEAHLLIAWTLANPPLGVYFPPLLSPRARRAVTLASMKYLPNAAFCK